MLNTNVLNAAEKLMGGLNTVSRLIDFSKFIDCEIGCRELAGDKRSLASIRATIYHEIYRVTEDTRQKFNEDRRQKFNDRRGIDRTNDQQNYAEAYARGEI